MFLGLIVSALGMCISVVANETHREAGRRTTPDEGLRVRTRASLIDRGPGGVGQGLRAFTSVTRTPQTPGSDQRGFLAWDQRLGPGACAWGFCHGMRGRGGRGARLFSTGTAPHVSAEVVRFKEPGPACGGRAA